IRPEDINLKVLEVPLEIIPVEKCTWTTALRTWIYSTYVTAVDCTGVPLTAVKLYNSTANKYIVYDVTVVLDEERGWYCGACYDFRIVNRTAVFPVVWTANQSRTYPHLFVAGAEYLVKVFYAGTLVYNYTIVLPRPDITTVEYFNYTAMRTCTVDKPWAPPVFNITYPKILEVTPVPEGEKPTIKLFTWVWPFKLYTTTVSGVAGYLVPNVRIELNVNGLLTADFVNKAPFEDLADDTEALWVWSTVPLAFYNYTDDYGEAVIRIPAWTYRISGGAYVKHENDIYIGTDFVDIRLIGGVDHFIEYYGETRTTPGFIAKYNNTIINWNGTAIETDPTYYPYKTFNWNKTVGLGYCGGFVVLPTTCMECFAVEMGAYASDEAGKEVVLEKARVVYTITVDGVVIYSGEVIGAETVKFEPELDGTKTLPDGTIMTVIKPGTIKATYIEVPWYTIEGSSDLRPYLEEYVTPYGLTVEDVFKLETLTKTITKDFTIENNCGVEVIPLKLKWAVFIVKVLDWAGLPLAKMTVFATPTGIGIPASVGVSRADGIALIYVAGGEYYIDIYWRDTKFLEVAGVIPKSLNIYASSFDEEAAWRIWSISAGGTVHRTVKTYAYKGVLRLLKADGMPLSADAIKKITVTIKWPDGVETKHTPDTDGTVKIVLNKDTVVSWPIDPSSAYNPESPPDKPQTPPGAYIITITWTGVPVPIYEGTITIERARWATPLLIFEVRTAVYDLGFKATTPFGTPLAAAEMEATKVDGTKVTLTTDAEGAATITEAPLGKATITKVIWKGVDITEYGV
ncbi:MAG: hypothetical protein DRN53_07180, partial [Thermoprotei archaeon]